mgnify:FL=1
MLWISYENNSTNITYNETWDFGNNLVITVSLGIAQGRGLSDVLKEADDKLYHSKQSGKNRVTL